MAQANQVGKVEEDRGDEADASPAERPQCFVMMPISDPPGYAPGHFLRVFEDILRPAIEQAGYRAVRADHVQEANLIHLDILQRLLDAPIALCDLSTRNANVLFELGFRQAFDRPVVLVREEGTPDLFDVALLRAQTYRPSRLYDEVLEDQETIRNAILATILAAERREGINSLVRLLGLTQPAALADVQQTKADPAFQLVRAELSEIRAEIRRLSARDLGGVVEPSFAATAKYPIENEIFPRPVSYRMGTERSLEHLAFKVDPALRATDPEQDVLAVGVAVDGSPAATDTFLSRIDAYLRTSQKARSERGRYPLFVITFLEPMQATEVKDKILIAAREAGVNASPILMFE